MKDLLQRLWDEYAYIIKTIGEATNDDQIDEELVANSIKDTEEMAQLRKDLFSAGVKNIAGFDYDL